MADAQAISVKVANAVAAELRGQTFTLDPTIRRRYVTAIPLSDLGALYIDVQSGGTELEAATRAETMRVCRVDIAVRKRFEDVETEITDEIETAEIDRLLLLMEEIYDFLAGRRLVAYDEAAWVDGEYRPEYFPSHLRQLRQFTGIVAVRFKVVQ